jgi:hypothetical protein
VFSARSREQRRLHKALLRYHDEANWDLLRAALVAMKRSDLIGSGEGKLVPAAGRTPAKRRRLRPARGAQWRDG